MSRALATFYGDDFTGSVDALLQFTRCGLRGTLFVGLPSRPELEQASEQNDVIGVAGIARSLPTGQIAAELVPAIDAFAALDPWVMQYKACSTADSSPDLGSLGRVVELGRVAFSARPIPVLVAQPDFGRYTVFGHHFAAENGTVYRLDRQPTMSTHPSTPMNESDLALHLGLQTTLPVAQLSFTGYESAAVVAADISRSAAAAVVLDALTDEHLELLGQAIRELPGPVFAIGSGGLSRAIASVMGRADGPGSPSREPARLRSAGPTLAVSGSRSAQTQKQLDAARTAGWQVTSLVVGSSPQAEDARAQVLELLASGRNVALSAHDADLAGIAPAELLPTIAAAAAAVIDAAVSQGVTTRVIVCGGDTSSRVIRLLDVRSLSIAANPWGNVVILNASGPGLGIDGVELMLKGGQVGDADLFEQVRLLGG